MIFHQIADGGCRSYLIGCPVTCAAALIDPALGQRDRYPGIAAREGLRTLRELGFRRAVALDGGMKSWRGQGYPIAGEDPALLI